MRFAVLIVSLLMLAGCARTWDQRPPTAEPGGVSLMRDGTIEEGPDAVASTSRAAARNQSGLVPPFGSSGIAAAYEFNNGYRIGSGDRLTIRVLGQTDLTAEYIVDGAGAISMPLVNSLPVAGLTTPEAERLIVARLRNGFLRDPNVSVQVTSTRPFYILGEVNQAGSYSYQNGMTVQQAVAIANGYSPRANQGKVLLTRTSADGTQSREVPVTTQIYPGDVVYVRERWF
jgi:polysaccharide biosynthesis/export protein